MKAGPLNLITDVAGLYVGNAADATLKSGVTAIICGEPVVAAVQVLGGAPGTRETDLLEPHNTVQTVDALVLSGGSGFGLDAASGVQAWLRERGRGFPVGPHRIPIVPAAILFDLANGGDKKWGRYPPYRELGHDAAAIAGRQFEIGTAGAGAGALTAGLKGGLGSASTVLNSGATVGALVAVNAVGSTTFDDEGHFWAAPFEKDAEFGGRGYPATMPREPDRIALKMRERAQPGGNTTIAVIATDIQLGKAEAKRLAISAHDGLARAIWPAHTAMDGDLVFALATGSLDHIVGTDDFIDLCAAAAATMARAVARGVYAASRASGDTMPTWTERFGGRG
jgi:L-aminopeptidase/D-esterase-like protein